MKKAIKYIISTFTIISGISGLIYLLGGFRNLKQIFSRFFSFLIYEKPNYLIFLSVILAIIFFHFYSIYRLKKRILKEKEFPVIEQRKSFFKRIMKELKPEYFEVLKLLASQKDQSMKADKIRTIYMEKYNKETYDFNLMINFLETNKLILSHENIEGEKIFFLRRESSNLLKYYDDKKKKSQK